MKRKTVTTVTGVVEKNIAISITNADGLHMHERNGEKFRGEQKDCPLCRTASPFEKALGLIGV